MLGKLIKHEFTAIGKVLLPLYLVMFALILIIKSYINIPQINNITGNNGILMLVVTLLFLSCFGVIVAVAIVTLTTIINRFYTTVFGDEGYLTNTLPVASWKIILAKGITATIWSHISALAIMAAIFVGVLNGPEFVSGVKALSEVIREYWAFVAPNSRVILSIILVTYLIAMLIQPFFNIMMFYLSMAIGQLANSHKKVAAFFSFVGITWLISIATNFVMTPASQSLIDLLEKDTPYLNDFNSGADALKFYLGTEMFGEACSTYLDIFVVGLVASIVLTLVLFFATKLIMDKKLNLE